ncbi:unnamed protein product [Moneuplotes crassus]|uniref:Uncharacterized protein n=1 Tax=Euplotes crassus TaxID=5936 RepID=A0AAD1U5B7_EUPCR|nr:unnamed protein product [Moneuplotes crassus]
MKIYLLIAITLLLLSGAIGQENSGTQKSLAEEQATMYSSEPECGSQQLAICGYVQGGGDPSLCHSAGVCHCCGRPGDICENECDFL